MKDPDNGRRVLIFRQDAAYVHSEYTQAGRSSYSHLASGSRSVFPRECLKKDGMELTEWARVHGRMELLSEAPSGIVEPSPILQAVTLTDHLQLRAEIASLRAVVAQLFSTRPVQAEWSGLSDDHIDSLVRSAVDASSAPMSGRDAAHWVNVLSRLGPSNLMEISGWAARYPHHVTQLLGARGSIPSTLLRLARRAQDYYGGELGADIEGTPAREAYLNSKTVYATFKRAAAELVGSEVLAKGFADSEGFLSPLDRFMLQTLTDKFGTSDIRSMKAR